MERYSVVIVSVPKNSSHFSLSRRFAICLNLTVSIFSDISHSNLRFLISLIASSSSTMRVSSFDTRENELSLVFQDFRLFDFIVWMSQDCIMSLFSLRESRYSTAWAILFRTSMSSRVAVGNVSIVCIVIKVKKIRINPINLRFTGLLGVRIYSDSLWIDHALWWVKTYLCMIRVLQEKNITTHSHDR